MPLAALSDRGIVVELGRRVAAHRAARRLTQGEFADLAGVGRSTVQRIEAGESIQLTSLVKLLRALDRLEALDGLLTPEVRSPLAELERERARRKRVRHPSSAPPGNGPTGPDSAAPPWVWGDDAPSDA